MADSIAPPPTPDEPDTDESPAEDRSVRIVFRLLRPIRLQLVGLTVLTVIGGLAEALLLVVVAQIAIAVTEARVVEEFGFGGMASWAFPSTLEGLYALAGGLLVIRLSAQLGAARMNARALTETQAWLRRDLVAAFVRADWATQSRERDGRVQDLVTTHINRAGSSVAVFAGAVSSVVNFGAMIGTALIVAPTTAAAVMVAVAGLFVVFRPLSRFSRRLAGERAAAGQVLAERVTEAVSSALEIRTTNVPELVVDELQAQTDAIRDLERRTTFVQAIMPPTYQALALVALLTALAGMYAWNAPAAGALGAVLLLLLRALSYSQTMQISYHQIHELAPYAQEVQDHLATYRDAAPVSGPDQLTGIDEIQMRDVSFSYIPGQPTLERLDLTLERGQMLGVIGPSGAGKSTFIQVLLGLRPPSSGEYLVNGRDRACYQHPSWFEQVAFVPQEPRLIAGSVGDNIRFWRSVDEPALESASRRALLHEDIAAMPSGYDTDVGPRGSRLSGGQKQRVTIARALVADPDLLVLDEPTSALDLRSEGLLEATFRQLRGELTMVVIAHRLSTVSACDRLLVLEHGRVQALGTPSEVEAVSPFFREALARTRAGFFPESAPDGEPSPFTDRSGRGTGP